MNRNALKRHATWARTTLTQHVELRAASLGITAKGIAKAEFLPGGGVVEGHTFDKRTGDLLKRLHEYLTPIIETEGTKKAVRGLICEMSYTWFNRLAALRYMEANGHIPRVLSSSEDGVTEPDLLHHAVSFVQNGELGSTTLGELEEWREQGDAFAYQQLLLRFSQQFQTSMPFLFGNKHPWAELFLPDTLLNQDGLVTRLVTDIDEDDWQQIEIIGWLYQFYISDEKDRVMAKRGAYDSSEIPAATQLFTPHWIVRYMVENSVGRKWLEHHPESKLREKMPYYLEPQMSSGGPERPAVQLQPQELTVMDPACGSGHILVYAFDLLFEIYTEQGFPERDIARLILEKNLFGLDLDERAVQLASFALLMKARSRDPRILRSPPKLNVMAVKHSRNIALSETEEISKADWEPLVELFRDADSLGSLITLSEDIDFKALEDQLSAFENSGSIFRMDLQTLDHGLRVASMLASRYQTVIANPPYMGAKSFNRTLKGFVNDAYPLTKSDLSAVFMERCFELTAACGIVSMINQQGWMFLSSYQRFREHLLESHTIQTLLQLGAHTFPEVSGEVVKSVAFTMARRRPTNLFGKYIRLVDYENSGRKEAAFLAGEQRFWRSDQQAFRAIAGSPVAFWLSQRLEELIAQLPSLSRVGNIAQGLKTGLNTRFMRQWFEVDLHKLSVSDTANSSRKWVPCTKGGEFRRWYGNNDLVLNWECDGFEIKNFRDSKGRLRSRPQNLQYLFREGITWTSSTPGAFSARLSSPEHAFESKGSMCFPHLPEDALAILGYLNSKVANLILEVFSPNFDFTEGAIKKLPFLKTTNVEEILHRIVHLARIDWDSFEASWDFAVHPLLYHNAYRIADAFTSWSGSTYSAFRELQKLEEDNNRYWIAAYGLEDELSPEVPDDQITIRRADLERDIRSLISYAVGCMMGRYSLASPGLQFGGGVFDSSHFSGGFLPDGDGVLPITDVAYFEDDVVSRFVEFLRAAYGPDHLQENLEFVADALTRRAGESALERIRRYFVNEFTPDHNQVYSKRPIYWLFTSGRHRAFNALVYLHRYTPDTLARLRTDYLLEFLNKLQAEVSRTEHLVSQAGSGRERTAAEKRLRTLGQQLEEAQSYHDLLQHKADQRIEIDLDDGVAYNYSLFEGLVYEGTDLRIDQLLKASQWKRDLLVEEEKQLESAT